MYRLVQLIKRLLLVQKLLSKVKEGTAIKESSQLEHTRLVLLCYSRIHETKNTSQLLGFCPLRAPYTTPPANVCELQFLLKTVKLLFVLCRQRSRCLSLIFVKKKTLG